VYLCSRWGTEKRMVAVQMYNNSSMEVKTISWWKLLLSDFIEKKMMQEILPKMPVKQVITW
jgi:hypothetical protein